jgi:bifunctional NMN adenylyltransferase/nudix hydrolase
MEKQFDLLVMILRGRLVHNGHKAVIDTALAQAHNVLLLIGSANRSRDTNGNEFIAEETHGMLRAVYPTFDADGIHVSLRFIDDEMHDEQDLRWLMGVQRAVADEKACINRWRGKDVPALRIGLIGFSKDQSSYYLKKFPQWSSVNVQGYRHQGKIVSATDLRREFFYAEKFGSEAVNRIRSRIPEGVARYLMDWAFDNHAIIGQLRAQRQFLDDYRKEHQFIGKLDKDGKPMGVPYQPSHTTTDAIVIQSGHVLLIRRKMNPGLGKWALPGGFVGDKEYTRDAVIRELKEETKIALSENVLRLAFRQKIVFSDPFRSERGRIITHAYIFLLSDRTTLPKVEGADDADYAEWVPLGELDPKTMHDDHYWIIMKAINMLPVD